MTAPRASTGRLAFLDVLRGVAALAVAFSHRAEGTISGFGRFDTSVFRFGQFGVVVFFLCSGFIIPASLERYGALRGFWISRFFRLFPLYWAVIAAALVLHLLGTYELPTAYLASPVEATAANATMMQAFLREPLALGLTWTLAFEMSFYLIMSGLFVVQVQRRSVPLAVLLLSLAAAAALRSADQSVLFSALALLPAGAAALGLVTGLSPARMAVAVAVGVAAVPLLLSGGYYAPWFALILFSALFSGTVMYRWVHGEVGGRLAGVVFVTAGAVSVGSCLLAADRISFVPTFLAAYGLFGAALLLRGRSWPRPLVRLGVISYSLYLVHPLVYGVLGNALDSTLFVRLVALVSALAISIALSELTYRMIEKPMISLGHRFAGRPAAAAPAVLADQPR